MSNLCLHFNYSFLKCVSVLVLTFKASAQPTLLLQVSNPRAAHAVCRLYNKNSYFTDFIWFFDMDKYFRESTVLGVDNLFKAPYTM